MDPGAERAPRPAPERPLGTRVPSALRPEPGRRNDSIATVAALLAHAAVLAIAAPFAARTQPIATPVDTPATAATALIEIDLHEPESPAPRPAPTADPEALSERPSPRDFASVLPGVSSGLRDVASAVPRDVASAVPGGPFPEVSPAASAAPDVAPGVASAPGDDYGVAPAVPMPGSGPLAGSPAWTVPGVLPAGPDVPGGGAPKPEVPVGPRATVAPGRGALVLRDTIAVHDRELGLGNPGGTTIANAVAEAVRGSLVPNEATAMLVVRVGGDGVVLSVGAQRFNAGDVKSWAGVAQAVTAALGRKKLGLVGLGPSGALVQVEVRSSVAYPSGSHDGPTSQLPSLKDGPPRDVMPAPSPDGGDACAPARHTDINPMCGVGMVVGQFDVTDLVTRKHRNVRASFHVKLLDDALTRTPPATTPVSAAPTAGDSAPSIAKSSAPHRDP